MERAYELQEQVESLEKQLDVNTNQTCSEPTDPTEPSGRGRSCLIDGTTVPDNIFTFRDGEVCFCRVSRAVSGVSTRSNDQCMYLLCIWEFTQCIECFVQLGVFG